jgi:hypothetical protein
MAVENMRTFGMILARIMPLHVLAPPTTPPLTVEQARAELKTFGLPENFIELMHFPDPDELDKDPIDDPWAQPETDDEQMVDVAPKPEGT